MSSATDYTNAAQQRILQLQLVLFSDVVHGYLPSKLAELLQQPASTITKDLANLRIAGLAERNEATGHWRLTPRLPQQSIKVYAAINAAVRHAEETRNRYTRNPD